MIEQLIFEPNEKVMQIDLETLEKSGDYDRGNKFPKNHYRLIKDILFEIKEEGLTAEVEDIFISKSGLNPPKERELAFRTDINSVNDTRGIQINNMIAKINFTGALANSTSCQSIAISYNKSGIELSFGTNISVCRNMNIFGDNYMRNHGQEHLNFEKMFEIMQLWLKTANKRREEDLRILENMKKITFNNYLKETREIIGHFNELLIINANTAPLRQGRITEVHRGLLEIQANSTSALSVYDIYQQFTESSSHQDVLENVIVNTAAIGNYFIERYNLLDNISEQTLIINSMTDLMDEPEQKPVGILPEIDKIDVTIEEAEEIITDSPEIESKSTSYKIDTKVPNMTSEAVEERIKEVTKIVTSNSNIKKNAAKIKKKKDVKAATRILGKTDLTPEQKEEAATFMEEQEEKVAEKVAQDLADGVMEGIPTVIDENDDEISLF